MFRSPAQFVGHILLATFCLGIAAPAAAQLFANGRPPRADVTLPDGPARQVILENCSQCHGIDEYGYYAMDRERWARVVDRMKTAKSGVVEGMDISDADREILLDWLVADFGPDSTPLERQYVIPELTDAELLSDAQGQSAAMSACSDCHGLERINDISLDADQWRQRVTQELGRGAALLIQDVEPFVQWLAQEPELQ